MFIKKYKQGLGFLILILVVLLFWYLGRALQIDIPAIQKWLSVFPPVLSAILYILLYVAVTFFIFFSKDLFWFMGAILFGPFLSALYICIAETINAFILFYLSRFLGRGYVEKNLSEKYRRLDNKLGKISLFWLFVFRAAPLLPYRFLDLASGLTGIRFKKYLIAVVFGSPFKMFWIQYILYGVGISIFNDPGVLAEYFLAHKPLLIFSLLYIILVVMVFLKIIKKD
jgi:uncharacterized membrane protein YdjX (TVP38/TMEM64 family)